MFGRQGRKKCVILQSMIDQRILDFIAEHHVLTVACVAGTAAPWCANAFYVFDPQEEGFIITSEEKTRHAQLFLENPQVAGSVVLETEQVGKIQGLQFTGTVRRCETSIGLKTVRPCVPPKTSVPSGSRQAARSENWLPPMPSAAK